MGTNYYAWKRINPKIVCEGYVVHKVYHLGKNSYGWRFHLQANDLEFYRTKKGMKQWTKNMLIFNEQGELISHRKFWNLVEKLQVVIEPPDAEFMDNVVDPEGYRLLIGEFS